MARYAIGDIQGCYLSLERLLATLGYSASRDQLWLVGDLVNRGPRNLEVLRWAVAQGGAVTTVLGNHDLHLLSRVAGAAGEKKRDTLDDVLNAPDRDALVDWLRAQPLLHVEGDWALVHGGLAPRWTIEEARAKAAEVEAGLRSMTWRTYLASTPERDKAALAYLVRARTLKPDGKPEPDFDGPPAQAPSGCVPWFAFPSPAWATHTVVYGHWAAAGLQVHPRTIGLDTGCVWGKQLSAIRLPDRVLTQVKAVEAAS